MIEVRIAKSKIDAKGVFARGNIKKGETILLMKGKQVNGAEIDERYQENDLRWDDPFEVGGDKYVLLEEVPLRINHACVPNTGIRGVNELFALRDIKRGEELFYDYSTVVGKNAPGESDWLMPCACGTPRCRGTIGNWLSLPFERLRFYKKSGALPDFVIAQLY